MLAVSTVVALYGLVHAFDLFRRIPAIANESRQLDSQPGAQFDLPARQDADARTVAAVDPQLVTDDAAEHPPLVGASAPAAEEGRPAKAPRKRGGRRSNAPKKAKTAEASPPEDAADVEFALPEATETAVSVLYEEATHALHAPLFEPEPFVRQHKAVFGRKAG